MVRTNPAGRRATADQVLAGVDLSGKHFVITGCNSGLGFETMNSLAANGATVVGLARSLPAAQAACERAGRSCVPVACDLSDLDSVVAAAAAVRALEVPLDAIVANAAVAYLPTLQTQYGVEMQFLTNHVGHFTLVNRLCDRVRDGAGRIVIVTSGASHRQSDAAAIHFDNLDGRRSYHPALFYDQSKLAAALYAKELSRRLSSRGIAVNAVDPGVTAGTGLYRHLRRPALRRWAARLFNKDLQRGAATQALLAASPRVIGISGELWADGRTAESHAALDDLDLARRLWDFTDRIVAEHTEACMQPDLEAQSDLAAQPEARTAQAAKTQPLQAAA
jgi:WW domain-containing oxidoreductase